MDPLEENDVTLESLSGDTADLFQEADSPKSVRDSLEEAVAEHEKASAPDAPADGEATAATEEAAAAPIEAPQHWSKEDRETFAKQPREAQEWLLARHKAMEGDNTRVSQQLSELQKWREPIEQVLAPYGELMQQHKLSPASVLQNYINAELQLSRDPVQGILMLAERYKVDPMDLVAAAQGGGANPGEQQTDPAIKALQDKIAQLEGNLATRDRAAQEGEARAMTTQITEFAESKGEDGQKLYPHIENPHVRNLMSTLIGTGQVDVAKAGGVVPALKQAYEQAVYAIPETRSALVKSLLESQAKEAADEQRRKVAKAKAAGVSVSGNSSAMHVAPAAKGSVRAQLEAAAREQGFIT